MATACAEIAPLPPPPSSANMLPNNSMNFTENQHGNFLLERLRCQRDELAFCDVQLLVDGQMFEAHRCVLAAASLFFERLFGSQQSPPPPPPASSASAATAAVKQQVSISCGGRRDIFGRLLDYIYSGHVVVDKHNVDELLRLANHFDVVKLKRHCCEYLQRYLSPANCVSLLDTAAAYRLHELYRAAVAFARAHADTVLRQPPALQLSAARVEQLLGARELRLRPERQLVFVLDWVQHAAAARESELRQLLLVVPLAQLPPSWLVQLAREHQLFAESERCLYVYLQSVQEAGVRLGGGCEQLYSQLDERFMMMCDQEQLVDNDTFMSMAITTAIEELESTEAAVIDGLHRLQQQASAPPPLPAPPAVDSSYNMDEMSVGAAFPVAAPSSASMMTAGPRDLSCHALPVPHRTVDVSSSPLSLVARSDVPPPPTQPPAPQHHFEFGGQALAAATARLAAVRQYAAAAPVGVYADCGDQMSSRTLDDMGVCTSDYPSYDGPMVDYMTYDGAGGGQYVANYEPAAFADASAAAAAADQYLTVEQQQQADVIESTYPAVSGGLPYAPHDYQPPPSQQRVFLPTDAAVFDGAQDACAATAAPDSNVCCGSQMLVPDAATVTDVAQSQSTSRPASPLPPPPPPPTVQTDTAAAVDETPTAPVAPSMPAKKRKLDPLLVELFRDGQQQFDSSTAAAAATGSYKFKKRLSRLSFDEESGAAEEHETATAVNARPADNDQALTCSRCVAVFSSSEALARHTAEHHAPRALKTYGCDVCGMETTVKRDYTAHMRSHFDGPPFVCAVCGVHVSSLPALLRHRRQLHASARPFACGQCGARFVKKWSLQMHARVHSGERPFACSECGARFASASTLRMHGKRHETARPLRCELCSFSTKYASHLKLHRRVHSGDLLRCRHAGCDYTTPRLCHLREHEQSHAQQRRHCCTVCGRAYNIASHLRRHMLTHQTERRFTCSQCDYSTYRGDRLKNHMLTHARDKLKNDASPADSAVAEDWLTPAEGKTNVIGELFE